jgi:hypothetical protein
MAIKPGSSAGVRGEEGTLYVVSTGQTFTQPRIDADRIRKYEDNIYLAGALDRQQRILFRDRKRFSVRGIDENNEEVPDLTSALTAMSRRQGVDLWFNAQVAWRESATWGPALFNPVWGWEEGEYVLQQLRHLPSETFQNPGQTISQIRNPILPGICLGGGDEIQFWQTQPDGRITRLENVAMVCDPVRRGLLGGKPLILPVIPVVTMLNFSWTGQMQQNNRLGAGGLFFIRVTNPVGDDREYAQKIIKNISRGVAYQLRQNMELVNLGLSETTTAAQTIAALDHLISNYFSPSSSISKDGTLIGGSSGPEFDLYMSYIQGQQSWVESAFESILSPYLDANGWSGCSVVVDIPEPSPDRTEQWLSVVKTGYETKTMSMDERREALSRCGIELADLNDEERAKVLEEFGILSTTAQEMGMRQAELMANVAGIDRLDPYALVSREEQSSLFRRTLGLRGSRREE